MSTLTRERVRGDVDVLSRAGLELEDFLSEAVASVQRAVPWQGACVGTHDPASLLLTSDRKYGDLVVSEEEDALFGVIEYDSAEATSYRHLAVGGAGAVGMSLVTHGEVERSERMERLMLPAFGYADEARLVFRGDDGTFWGGLAAFRGPEDPAFDEKDVEFLAGLGPSFARGVRAGVLARVAHTVPASAGPAVVIVGADGQVSQASASALARLDELSGVSGGNPAAVVAALVATARRLARTGESDVARARLRTPSGQWLLLHASPLAGLGDRAGEVVVTIEEARPPEIVSLVVAAFGLTQRERDVTALVLQGVDTKEIAATLHVSAYTVQDHLKSVFDKADVRSRRELIARIFFDQYVPRMGTGLGPTGWYAG